LDKGHAIIKNKWRMEMFTRTQSGNISLITAALLAGSLLVSGCSPAVAATPPPKPAATLAFAATLEPTASAAMAVPPTDSSLRFSLDTGSMATGFQTEKIAAIPASDNAPYWEVLPAYTRVTLQGYPIENHVMKPQIFIYPVKELGNINEGAGKIAAALQSLLQAPQEMPSMPFLPLINARQVMHHQEKHLDFKSGKGISFLTEFSQGIVPINNYELIYTYQGLTSDGKYYVAAVLPVNHPSLPADEKVTGNEPPEFAGDYLGYLANVVKMLDPQTANTFTPDLSQLDVMMSSLEIM
jgi:hypothetical protein